MELSYRQRPVQRQQQTLAPMLMKSLQLLSLPYPSLVSFLEHHALENPFLELSEAAPAFDFPVSWAEADCQSILMDTGERDPAPLFHSSDPMETLQEHLRLQLLLAGPEPALCHAGERIIAAIDDRGYFRETPESFARRTGLAPETVEQALRLIRTFTPAGVGAFDLADCLLLQAEPGACDMALLQAILSAPPERIEKRDYRYFASLCRQSPEAVKEAFRYLATLSPAPGSAFDRNEPVHYIYPEIEVRVRGGALELQLHSGCDLITVNEPLFRAMSGDAAADPAALDYIREKYREASALAQELLLRKNAMEKLLIFLLQEQRDFFLLPHGPLKPITMRQAAAAIGMNPSTVSRCVSGRYIQTRDGIVPLKQLFSVGYPAGQASTTSAAEIKKAIRARIGSESPQSPLTDQELAAQFAAQGIPISRRTVAKYREQLEIPGSRDRHRKGSL